jgi:hypothetical protein
MNLLFHGLVAHKEVCDRALLWEGKKAENAIRWGVAFCRFCRGIDELSAQHVKVVKAEIGLTAE